MRTVRRLFYRDAIGRQGRAVWHVALAALYEVPGHFYDLLPIAVLIGTIYALARMAQASEYTILRTGGLGPGRALRLLALLGVAFGALNFFVGDYLTPAAERASQLLAARFDGGRQIGRAGAWLKERPQASCSRCAPSSSTPTAAWWRASPHARPPSAPTAAGR